MAIETYPTLGANALQYGMAVDYVGSAYYGYAKAIWGPDGSAYHVTASTQLPVVDSGLATLLGTSNTSTAGILLDTADIEIATELVATTVKLESSVPAGNDPGVVILGIRDDALSTLAITDGDWAIPRITSRGAWHVGLDTTLDATNDGIRQGFSLAGSSLATPMRKYLRVTSSTTSTDVWVPASGKKFAITSYTITWHGSLACRITLWQGSNADTTFSGTEPVMFDMDLVADSNSGVAYSFPDAQPWITDVDDDELHLTLSANKTVAITLNGYEFD